MSTSESNVKVADLLGAVRDHLVEHSSLPEPYTVRASSSTSGSQAAVSVHLLEFGLANVAGVLAIWADTLTRPSLSIWRPPSSDTVHIQVSGCLPGEIPIEVWAGVKAPFWAATVEPGQPESLDISFLRTWAAPSATKQTTADTQTGGTA